MSAYHLTLPARSIVCSAIALLLPLAALAQGAVKEGYLLDASGGFVHSGTPGQCWHTGSWTPALAQEGCDPVAQVAVAPAPMVVAAAPVVAPMPAPAPAPKPAVVEAALPQKMSLSADALFAFDKATITPEGKLVLDDASRQILGMTGGTVKVVGHADRMGSDAYNQKLSDGRAHAVRDYLVFKGVPIASIEATGVGETQPITKPGDCLGHQSAKVIACLQPDRRVDVDMTGSRTAAAQ